MSKYVTIDAVRWALARLRNSCNRLFVDFLILKHEGLTPDQPVTITSVSTAASAARFMGIVKDDGTPVDNDHYFYNPIASIDAWRKREYPRSGIYTTIERSRPLSKVVDVSRNDTGIQIALKSDYVDAAAENFKRTQDVPVRVSLLALSIWSARYDELEDDVDVPALKERFLSEYNITPAERSQLLSEDDEDEVGQVFGDEPLAKTDLMVELGGLVAIKPTAPSPAIVVADSDVAPEPQTVLEDLPEDLIEFLRGDLLLPETLLRQAVTLLRAGKHLILTGPPGTGKSTLAVRLAQAGMYAAKYKLPASSGHIFTTATSDWTTFDTVGGYMPALTGNALSFNEGLFLQSIRTNQWVVIDELNRADVDKAFGQFFTVLSGHGVQTPFHSDEHPVDIQFDRNVSTSRRLTDSSTYVVGSDWRVIATMNTFDRNLLFQLSAAFVRRFAVVYVGIPGSEELKSWIQERDIPASELPALMGLIDLMSELRPLGPAIWSDVADYLEVRRSESTDVGPSAAGSSPLLEAIISYILPQLDGLDRETLMLAQDRLGSLMPNDECRRQLGQLFTDLF